MGSGQSAEKGEERLTTYETGVKTHEVSFNWKIKNFREIFENESLTNSQKIAFHVENKWELPSNWMLFLHCGNTADDGKWTGIYYEIKDRPSEPKASLFVKCEFSLQNADGETVWQRRSKVVDCSLPQNQRCGFAKMIKEDSDLSFLVDDSLVMGVTFKIFVNSEQTQYVTHRKREREEENEPEDNEDSDESDIKRVKVEA